MSGVPCQCGRRDVSVVAFKRNTSLLIRRIGDMGHQAAADWRCTDCVADLADEVAAATIRNFHPDFCPARDPTDRRERGVVSTQVVTPTRREYWTTTDADGVTRTAAVEVGETYFGSQVVVVSLELLRQMLSDLGFAMQAENDHLDAPGQLSDSNRRSVEPGDAGELEGAQNALPEFACDGCAFCTGTIKQESDESEADRG